MNGIQVIKPRGMGVTFKTLGEDDRLLVLEPVAQDLHQVLDQFQATLHVCNTLKECCTAISDGASLAIIPAQSLDQTAIEQLATVIANQPLWSDFPLIIIATADLSLTLSQDIDSLGNIRVVEYPFRPQLVASIISATLRSRHRQFMLRDRLSEHASNTFQDGVATDISSASDETITGLDAALEALKIEHNRLRTVLDVLPIGVHIADKNGNIVQDNAAARNIWGDESIVANGQRGEYKAWWPDGRPFSTQDWGLAKTLRSGMRCEQEVEIENGQGQRKTLLNYTAPIFDQSGQILGGVAVNVDISERKRNEQELARLAAIVTTSNDAIIGKTPEGIITSWNAGAERMLGYSAEEVQGQDTALVIPPEHRDEASALLAQIKNGETLIERDFTFVKKDGTQVKVSLSLSPIRDSYGNVIAITSIARDITERKNFEDRLQYNAFHDVLTGLANRSLFLDRLQHAMLRARRQEGQYAVLMLDMDNFKVINDRFGHPDGDALLIKFAHRVQECLRPGDTLARFGGDEFTILLDEVEGADSALHVAERIRAALEKPFDLSNTEVFSTASIGVVLGHASYVTPDSVMRDADIALYEAKHRGRSRYVMFDIQMRKDLSSRLQMEAELRKAISKNELCLQYQPIVELATARVIGCEALLRWHHPLYGDVEPIKFIALAEEAGLIVPLGEFVIESACRDLASWFRSYYVSPDFYISLNLTPKQFVEANLIDFIDLTLSRYDLKGCNLRLEITESVIMKNDGVAEHVLMELRKRGIRICMDDFGMGYASLSYLQRFPIDILKVDQSFVHRMVKESASREVVKAIVALADNLHLEAIAEGAEDDEQVEVLRSLGCRLAQGFMFYHPLHNDKMLALLGSKRDHLH